MSHCFPKFWLVCIASVALATQFGNGCTSDGGDDDYYDYPNRPPYDGENDRPGKPDSGYSELEIPSRARIVDENRSDILRYRPSESGRVWLTDADRRILIDSRTVQRDEEYVASTKDGKVWIDKNRVLDHNFDRGNVHRIYFLGRNDEGGESGGSDERFGSGAGTAVPKSASIVREGRGEDLSFVADSPGMVFLYDVDGRTTVATYRVKRGERFTVSPSNGKASVDGRPAFSRPMSTRKVYRIYFDKSV